MFIELILRNWQLIVIGLLLVALAGSGFYVKMLKSNIVALEAEKASLVVKLEVSNASIAALQKSITEQNLAVEKFKEAASEREKANRNELAKAKVDSGKLKKRADNIMVRVIPKDTSAADAANQLFNEEIENIKKSADKVTEDIRELPDKVTEDIREFPDRTIEDVKQLFDKVVEDAT